MIFDEFDSIKGARKYGDVGLGPGRSVTFFPVFPDGRFCMMSAVCAVILFRESIKGSVETCLEWIQM